jgi:2-iminobutanoate/2-iminopropanoate deaminase
MELIMMREVLPAPLPDPAQPFSWITRGAGLLFTGHGPVRADGTLETGSSEKQIALTLSNLRDTLQAAGSDCDRVLQMTVWLCRVEDVPLLDRLYRQFFSAPWPNRATVIVERLVADGMNVEIAATALAGEQ